MKFKIGDKVRLIKNEGYGIKIGDTGIVRENSAIPYVNWGNKGIWAFNEHELELVTKMEGIELLEQIKSQYIKNCDIKVYKNNKYQFTIQCGEKAILDNPKHHIGMLTSNKYTYEPVLKKEMTISEIEKELGYSIKIVKE